MATQFAIKPLSYEDYKTSFKYPAATSLGRFYLIQDDKVIGRVKMVSGIEMANGIYSHVCVEPDDEATKDFFKDDFTIASFGRVTGLRYNGMTGRPVKNFNDEPDNRHKGTEIVDATNFDFGIAHPRFARVEGWDNVKRRTKPSIHSNQLVRRRRSSNKIKKVK